MILTMGHDERNAKFTTDEVIDTLTACDWKDPPRAVYLSEHGSVASRKPSPSFYMERKKNMADKKYVVRRLTPLECCRLQGFPDDWCEGVPGSESAQYKMWGNGMALPNALHVVKGIRDLLVDEMLE